MLFGGGGILRSGALSAEAALYVRTVYVLLHVMSFLD